MHGLYGGFQKTRCSFLGTSIKTTYHSISGSMSCCGPTVGGHSIWVVSMTWGALSNLQILFLLLIRTCRKGPLILETRLERLCVRFQRTKGVSRNDAGMF